MPSNNLSNKIFNFLLDSYDEVFVPDGFDNLNGTINGETRDFESDRVKSFRKSPLTRWSTFLGLANRELKPGEPQSFWNLFDNFFGVKLENSVLRNVLRIFLITPINVLSTPFKFLRNVLKIFTELLPYIGLTLSQQLQDKLFANFSEVIQDFFATDNNQSKSKQIFKILLYGALLALNKFIFVQTFAMLLAIGRAITSPILAVLIAWHGPKTSQETKLPTLNLEKFFLVRVVKKIMDLKKKYQKYLNGLAVAFSITTTMLTYSVVVPYLALAAAPLLTAKIPAIGNSINGLVGLISPVLTSISQAVLPFAEPIVTYFIEFDPYPPIATMTEIMGLSLIAGVAVTTLGTAVYKISEVFRNWWWKNPAPVNNNRKEIDNHVVQRSSWQLMTKTLFNDAVTKVALSTKTIRLKILNMMQRVVFQCIKKEFPIKPRLLTHPSNVMVSDHKIKLSRNIFSFFSSAKVIRNDITEKSVSRLQRSR